MAKRKQQGLVLKGGSTAAPKEPKEPKEGKEEPQVAADAGAAAARVDGGKKKKRRKTKAGEPAPTAQARADGSSSDEAVEAEPAAAGAASVASAASVAAAGGDAGEPPASPVPSGPALAGRQVLEWLLWPLSPEVFFEQYWEKKPLHLKRSRNQYYGDVFSKAALDKHLADGTPIGYGHRINLARFDNERGQKIDLNKGAPGEPAKAKDVNATWAAGGSLQVMHMQQFHEPVWRLLAGLERGFGALVGANAYLTPGGWQGLAPHFDDVEVFMLQLEGSKKWRLFNPPSGEEFPLPREYSRDFKPGELDAPVLDCVLEAGDMLYVPRGFVHAGVAEASAGFSHHLTVSTYHKTAWCNFMELALSSATERAAAESADFREGLPLGFLRHMGSFNDFGASPVAAVGAAREAADLRQEGRAAFSRKFKAMLKRLEEYVDLDEVCDQMGIEFTNNRLPPPPAQDAAKDGDAVDVDLESRVRWVDPSTVRAMVNDDPDTGEPTVMLFHPCGNDRTRHMTPGDAADEEEVGCLRFEAATFLSSLRALLALPAGASMRCGDLPVRDEDTRVALCEHLVEAGLMEVEAKP